MVYLATEQGHVPQKLPTGAVFPQLLCMPLCCTVQIAAFFGVFYTVVGGIFAAHLAVFITISPKPSENITPWNFGKYAYPNYPNAKIGMH